MPRLRRPARVLAVFLGLIPVGLLVVTLFLSPDPSGHGTHRQLGLPPCTLIALTGTRCPACGMTTSWTMFTHGHWPSSFRANSGGFLLAFVAIWFATVSFGVGFRGHAPTYRQQTRFAFALIAVLVVTLADWCYRLLA